MPRGEGSSSPYIPTATTAAAADAADANAAEAAAATPAELLDDGTLQDLLFAFDAVDVQGRDRLYAPELLAALSVMGRKRDGAHTPTPRQPAYDTAADVRELIVCKRLAWQGEQGTERNLQLLKLTERLTAEGFVRDVWRGVGKTARRFSIGAGSAPGKAVQAVAGGAVSVSVIASKKLLRFPSEDSENSTPPETRPGTPNLDEPWLDFPMFVSLATELLGLDRCCFAAVAAPGAALAAAPSAALVAAPGVAPGAVPVAARSC